MASASAVTLPASIGSTGVSDEPMGEGLSIEAMTAAPAEEDAADFGTFVYKNLEALGKANEDVIRKLKSEQLAEAATTTMTTTTPTTPSSDGLPTDVSLHRTGSRSHRRSRNISISELPTPLVSSPLARGPSIKSTSNSGDMHLTLPTPTVDALRGGPPRSRVSLPARVQPLRIRTEHTSTESSPSQPVPPMPTTASTAASTTTAAMARSTTTTARGPHGPWDVLIADDNPVACKILETVLRKLNCRCVVVRNGAEAIRCAMGKVVFDIIFMDVVMPIVDGEAAARMIKSTNNANRHTPIVAVTAYEHPIHLARVFDEVLVKPVDKATLQHRLRYFCQLRRNVAAEVASARV
ncbi:CheY-like superfamily [Syncephalis pseudoplumigaleata]|uniref:CheY-like superfamily n=1 Tax=Syncephalis pseudoplumigaleata TaxID=1712513 RepID=A0A4P9Z0J1_9FUNG|nr:CheY-like superfamily [Syncephalis pseudoplumigaleata]|eukprot:RKP25977.1 CheY-like superfamily [Syncephalis pseudoplumigaleata]